MSVTKQQKPKDNPYYSLVVKDAKVTLGAEAANIRNVALVLQDRSGRPITQKGFISGYLADDVDGDIPAVTQPTGGLTAGTVGTLFRGATEGAITPLTDNSAGTANNTIESMADIATAGGAAPTAAQVDTAVNGVLAKIRNNFADLAAKLNSIVQGGGTFMLASEEDGTVDFNITETGVKTFYLVLMFPNGGVSITPVAFV